MIAFLYHWRLQLPLNIMRGIIVGVDFVARAAPAPVPLRIITILEALITKATAKVAGIF